MYAARVNLGQATLKNGATENTIRGYKVIPRQAAAPELSALSQLARSPGEIILPIVVPPSPPFPVVPRPPGDKSNNTFWWIAGLLTLFIFAAKATPIPRKKRRAKSKPGSSLSGSGLSGEFSNCLLWQEVEDRKTQGLLWRCLKFAPACSSTDKECTPATEKFQNRVCIESKQVKTLSPYFKKKTVSRCKKYVPACTTSSCLPAPFEKPEPSMPHGMDISRMVQDTARSMAEESNLAEEEVGKAFGREIVDRGGLKPHRLPTEGRLRSAKKGKDEEFEVVPLFMRRKDGLSADEMASEMGYPDENSFLEAIRKEYPRTAGKKKRVFKAEDFIAEAEATVFQALESQNLGAVQQDLFPGLRRELVLQQVDLATSDDPVEAYLERKGWKLKRIRQLRESAVQKSIPDPFTGKTEKLSKAELEVQRDTNEFFDKMKEPRLRSQKEPTFLGLSGMSTERIAAGVRKAVKKDASRKAHGDTSLRAFFITPDLDIVSWKDRNVVSKLSRDTGNTAVHSHSAENWNYLRQLTGKLEPETRFSIQDLKNFKHQVQGGLADTKALIMGDGRMIVLRCPTKDSTLFHTSDQSITGSKLKWKEMDKPEYADLGYNEAARKKQQKYVKRLGCTWEEAEWKDRDAAQPMLFHLIPNTRQEHIESISNDPQYDYTTPPGKKKADLSKEFSLKVSPAMRPTDPVQDELFVTAHRTKKSSKGERKITMSQRRQPTQIRLLGG